jgi:predicted small lipoprotein YifL
MLAALAALVLSLAACGLKGSLDLPPAPEPPPRAQLEGQAAMPAPEAEAARPATSPRKRIFLDWLLD